MLAVQFLIQKKYSLLKTSSLSPKRSETGCCHFFTFFNVYRVKEKCLAKVRFGFAYHLKQSAY